MAQEGGTAEYHYDSHRPSKPCGACGGSGNAYKSTTCSTCGGSGKVSVSCGTCGGDGRINERTEYGPHNFVSSPGGGGKHCSRCNTGGGPLASSTCSRNPIKVSDQCGTCGGSGKVSGTCSSCGGSGDGPDETVPGGCTNCGGDGKVPGSRRYYNRYQPFYLYVGTLNANFTNAGGAIASGEWNYGWKICGSNCTKDPFSNSANANGIDNLKSISLSGANYATFTVTVKCKQYFEDVFEKTSNTDTLNVDLSQYHYELIDRYNNTSASRTWKCQACDGTGKINIVYREHEFTSSSSSARCIHCNTRRSQASSRPCIEISSDVCPLCNGEGTPIN